MQFTKKLLGAIFLALFTVIPCFLYFFPATAAAKVATSSSDPLVTIASDITTTYGPCSLTIRRNIGTTHETTQKFACPANTFLQYIAIKRSQAIAQHEAYVLIPTANAPTSEQELYRKQISQLDTQKHQYIQQSFTNQVPSSNCGDAEQSITADAYPNGLHYRLTVYYFKLSDCSIAFDTVSVYVVNDDGGSFIWQYDLYAGSSFNTGCSFTPSTGQTISHNGFSGTYPAGYGYEFWFGTSAVPCTTHSGGNYSGYVSPIN